MARLSWPKPFRPRYPNLSIQVSNIVHDGERSIVYEGNYVGKTENVKLAIKISDYPKMLAVEAQRYTSMRALQGLLYRACMGGISANQRRETDWIANYGALGRTT